MSKRIKLEFDEELPEPEPEPQHEGESPRTELEPDGGSPTTEIEPEKSETGEENRQVMFDRGEAEPEDERRDFAEPSKPKRRAMASKWPKWDPEPPATLIRRNFP